MGEENKSFDRAAISRRSLIKRLVAAGFAIPVISSFVLDGDSGALGYNPGQGIGSLGSSNPGGGIGQLDGSWPNGYGYPHHRQFMGNMNPVC